MEEDELARDPLKKVSGQLRKAVGLNKHEYGGLRNTVSLMNREKNKSVGLLSKQQQDFLQKQAKLLPALNAKRKSKKTTNQVIPLSHDQIEMPVESAKLSPKSNVPGISAQFNVLPPIRQNRRIGFVYKSSAIESEAKQRRISDYQKEFSSLQESINNAHRFAAGNNRHVTHEKTKRTTVETEDNVVGARKQGSLHLNSLKNEKERDVDAESKIQCKKDSTHHHRDRFNVSASHVRRHRTSSEVDNSNVIDTRVRTETVQKTISPIDEVEKVAIANKPDIVHGENSVIFEEEEESKKSNWTIVRNMLGVIASMNKKRHSQYLEQLYQEIRQCRYIRRPRRKNPSTGLWHESGEESEND